MQPKQRKLFCEISPLTYKISTQKEILLRKIKDLKCKEKFSKTRAKKDLENVVSHHSSTLIKRAPGIDISTQINKAKNIEIANKCMDKILIHPGEAFSFWKLVGNTTKAKGYKEGRVIKGGVLVPGIGGGLCNLANSIFSVVIRSPLTIIERHTHSDALAPDGDKRVPLATGTSVNYNTEDFRFRNDTDQDVELLLYNDDEKSHVELRSEREFPYSYNIVEEDHHFEKEEDKFFRISKIYRETIDKKTNEVIKRELVLDNHSEVMFDYSLIPNELIRV